MCNHKKLIVAFIMASMFVAVGCGSSEYQGYIKMRNQACKASLGEYDPVKDICLCQTDVGGISCVDGWVCDSKSSKCRACMDGERKCENGKYSECWNDVWIDIPESSPFYVTCDNGCDEYGKGSEVIARENNCVPNSPFLQDKTINENPILDIEVCDKIFECKKDDNGQYKKITCKNGIKMDTNEVCDECGEDGSCVKYAEKGDECTANESQCVNNIHKVCQKVGDRLIWQQQETCSFGCAEGGNKCACDKNVAAKCDGNNVVTCENGGWRKIDDCENGCVEGKCVISEEKECNSGDAQCVDDKMLRRCDNGKWGKDEKCENGCENGKCKDELADGRCGQKEIYECKSQTLMECDGDKWQEVEECHTKQSMCFVSNDKKIGNCGSCLNEDKRCSKDGTGASIIQICNNGKWETEENCGANGKICGNYEGSVICKTNENVCEGNNAKYYLNDGRSGSISCRKCESGGDDIRCYGCPHEMNIEGVKCVCENNGDCQKMGINNTCEENKCVAYSTHGGDNDYEFDGGNCNGDITCVKEENSNVGKLVCSEEGKISYFSCGNASCSNNKCGVCLNDVRRCNVDGNVEECMNGFWVSKDFCSNGCEDNGDDAKCKGEGEVCVEGKYCSSDGKSVKTCVGGVLSDEKCGDGEICVTKRDDKFSETQCASLNNLRCVYKSITNVSAGLSILSSVVQMKQSNGKWMDVEIGEESVNAGVCRICSEEPNLIMDVNIGYKVCALGEIVNENNETSDMRGVISCIKGKVNYETCAVGKVCSKNKCVNPDESDS